MTGLYGFFLVLAIITGIYLGIYFYKNVKKRYYTFLTLLVLPYIILHYLSTVSSNLGLDETRWLYFCGMIAFLLTFFFKERLDKDVSSC